MVYLYKCKKTGEMKKYSYYKKKSGPRKKPTHGRGVAKSARQIEFMLRGIDRSLIADLYDIVVDYLRTNGIEIISIDEKRDAKRRAIEKTPQPSAESDDQTQEHEMDAASASA